ncbi:MAG: hypothetical protein KKC68_01010 [Candidatus Thermoplasmatota archaeon]|nr:hypothetical protein [Candidatus Thermoplasmatota archaeon]MBU1940330.1 hypothetical protein [Candidatus Thermoplasmatota archaeon]
MEKQEICNGRIAEVSDKGNIEFEFPNELYQLANMLYNALGEIPKEPNVKTDSYNMIQDAIAWLETELPNAEHQLKTCGGITNSLVKKLIATIRVISGVFDEYQTEKGDQYLQVFVKHFKLK